MQLRPDVRLISLSGDDLRKRLFIADGTQEAQSMRKQSFCPDSFIPAGPWRPVTPDEIVLLASEQVSLAPGAWLTVIRVPDELLQPFALLRSQSQVRQEIGSLAQLVHQFEAPRFLAPILDYCYQFQNLEHELLEGAGIRVNLPGLVTVTSRPANGCFIGLHLDSWYPVGLARRHLSPNRISINLGSEDRYFVYINLQLQTIGQLVGQPSQPGAMGADFPRIFMRRFPLYPVVSLRVGPGEAYIAPTENIVHDASTFGNEVFDIHLTIRGHFVMPGLNRSNGGRAFELEEGSNRSMAYTMGLSDEISTREVGTA